MTRAIAELPGLGPVMQRRLAAVGIRDEHDLREVGSVEAYARLAFEEGRPPGLNALHAMEAALQDRPWWSLPAPVKAALAEAVAPVRARARRSPVEGGDGRGGGEAGLASRAGPASMGPCRESPPSRPRRRPARGRTSPVSAA